MVASGTMIGRGVVGSGSVVDGSMDGVVGRSMGGGGVLLLVVSLSNLVGLGRRLAHHLGVGRAVRLVHRGGDSRGIAVLDGLMAGLNVEHCGQFHPKHCRTRHKVGILVPFKDRESHLKSFTNHIHPFLQKQNLNYRIYIINQAHPEKFNRGKLFNVGFVEALKDYDWDCFIFHDVDLLPEDDRNLYSCSKLPKHMSVATSKTNYRLPYNQYIGGVLSMTKEHIFKVNGFSNKYWGWGGEDDDIYYRISNHRLRNRRINQTIGRYTALQHEPAEKNKQAGALVKQLQKSKQTVDGLVNLRYHLISMECSKLYTNLTNVSECGQFQPKHCRARQKVAILVPFKDRESHLKSFTNHMHPFLQGQNLDYRIYVINQVHPEKFNRAKLFNVGFVEALKDYNWDCFIFHDVDLLPEDDRNLYTCSKLPKHMSVAVSKLNYQLMYPELFGGVVALTRQHMLKLNGFSNQFWGWGGEDDDMFNQIQLNNMTIVRISNALARYTALPHVQAQRNPAARKLVTESSKKKRMHEGLTTLKYHLVNIECSKLYTNISANLDS
eukprot:maker-scaffold612_size124412-snap-gene-0.20 protein:Tk03317 transcript:maker-scaffold612_size124412-snap-gene-0.20-mRNA-1 annotation:"unnamed protein product"